MPFEVTPFFPRLTRITGATTVEQTSAVNTAPAAPTTNTAPANKGTY